MLKAWLGDAATRWCLQGLLKQAELFAPHSLTAPNSRAVPLRPLAGRHVTSLLPLGLLICPLSLTYKKPCSLDCEHFKGKNCDPFTSLSPSKDPGILSGTRQMLSEWHRSHIELSQED